MMSLRIQVDAYSGYRADERPIRFSLHGRLCEVSAVEDRWYSPDAEYFRVRTTQNDLFVLRHDPQGEEWSVPDEADSGRPVRAGISEGVRNAPEGNLSGTPVGFGRRCLAAIGERLYREPAVVLFDGSCSLCRRIVASLRTVDVFGRLTYVNALDEEARRDAGAAALDPDALMREMHVVAGARTWSGFGACRVVAARIPLLWPVWPFLYVWPVPALGRRIYRCIADSRTCRPDRSEETPGHRP